jgi:hypothetical protein
MTEKKEDLRDALKDLELWILMQRVESNDELILAIICRIHLMLYGRESG